MRPTALVTSGSRLVEGANLSLVTFIVHSSSHSKNWKRGRWSKRGRKSRRVQCFSPPPSSSSHFLFCFISPFLLQIRKQEEWRLAHHQIRWPLLQKALAASSQSRKLLSSFQSTFMGTRYSRFPLLALTILSCLSSDQKLRQKLLWSFRVLEKGVYPSFFCCTFQQLLVSPGHYIYLDHLAGMFLRCTAGLFSWEYLPGLSTSTLFNFFPSS